MSKIFPEYPVYSPEHSPFSRKLEVRLLALSTAPLDIEQFTPEDWTALNAATTLAGEAALTCYSPDLLTPLEFIKRSDKHRDRVLRVAADTRQSGHHSTREHINYIFAVGNLSRIAIYKLHSHDHLVSDQESQRYVTMSEDGVVLPRTGNHEANRLIETAANELFVGYEQLTAILIPIVRGHYLKRFPGKDSQQWAKLVDEEALKRAQEIARYLLPLSMGANLYHSINELTLIRWAKLTQDDPGQDPELYYFVKAMVDAVAAVDPSIREEIGQPLSISTTPDYQYFLHHQTDPYAAADEFDAYLAGLSGRLDNQTDLDHHLARAVRLTLGVSETVLPDSEAIDLVMNPAKNPLLASVNGEMVLHQLSRALNQVNLSALVTLSHVIDSQLQRHRGINHTRPLILPIPRLEQDIVIPALVAQNQQALDLYLKLQAKNIAYMEELASFPGIGDSTLAYLQTNAVRIRKSISGPLGAFHHLFRLRTCLNAQEENYALARTLIGQLPAISPLIAEQFEKPAPCGIRVRAQVFPICPEGKRYCGIPVWKKTIADYPDRDI